LNTSSNTYDIFDSDSDNDENVEIRNISEYRIGIVNDDLYTERLSERMETEESSSSTSITTTSSSSSSSSTALTINRGTNNFTDPYVNNLENFDDYDVKSALNNCGFFACDKKIKRR